jgi:hypothetical protein
MNACSECCKRDGHITLDQPDGKRMISGPNDHVRQRRDSVVGRAEMVEYLGICWM